MKHLLVLSSLVVFGLPAGARQPQQDQQDASEPEPARMLILHLDSGKTVRGKARLVQDVWEVHRRGTVERVPASSVGRIASEKEVLIKARSLEREVSKEPAHRVAYGEWCIREGLVDQGLQQLDLVLARHADQPYALAALRRTRPDVDLPPLQLDGADAPQRMLAFLREAAGLRPAARELAVLRLGDLE